MTNENLNFYEPTEAQLRKFHSINSVSPEIWDELCRNINDCSICPMAIHKRLLSTTKNVCTYGIGEDKFRILMFDVDCEY